MILLEGTGFLVGTRHRNVKRDIYKTKDKGDQRLAESESEEGKDLRRAV